MEKLRKALLLAIPPLGVVWHIWAYISTATRWGDANLTYARNLAEGGFFTLLIPIVLWLCFYFRSYYILVISILIIVMMLGWGSW